MDILLRAVQRSKAVGHKGKPRQEAIKNIREAIELYLEPEPKSSITFI